MGLNTILKREIKITIATVLIVSTVFTMISYAIFKVDAAGETNAIEFGDISMSFCSSEECDDTLDNIGNVIGTQKDAYGNTYYVPIYPTEEPKKTKDWDALSPYVFKLSNTGDLPLYITLMLEKDELAGTIVNEGTAYEEQLDDSEVKIAFGEMGATPTIKNYSDTKVSDGTHIIAQYILINPGETKIFNLYAWLKMGTENASQGKYFVTQISARGEYLPAGEDTPVDEDLKTIEIDVRDGVSTPNIKQIKKGGNVEFEITFDDDSELSSKTISCSNSPTTSILENKLIFTNVQSNHMCTIY